MRITAITTTPLLVPYRAPFHWAHGVIRGAEVVLVEVATDAGITGYGETIGGPSARAMEALIAVAARDLIGADPSRNRRLMRDAYAAMFRAQAVCSAPRFAGQLLAGIEMALWDIMGKAAGLPVHALMGGAVHDRIAHHGFAMGADADEIAAEADRLAAAGFGVIYIKAGRSLDADVETVARVRAAIGPGPRLRIDPNEAWSPLAARQALARLAPYDLEFVEQPSIAESIPALARLRAVSPVGIAADQCVFTPAEAFEVCRTGAADLIVIGPHETGGLAGMAAVARIAEAAGLNICIHGLYETGITACAAHQVAATCPNLDDGNQNMIDFLEWDILAAPDMRPRAGTVPLLTGPGLGFALDRDAVARAAELHRRSFPPD